MFLFHHPYSLAAATYSGLLAAAWHGEAIQIFAALSPLIAVYLAWRLRQIHILVNAQRTALENRIAQLEATIKGSNAEVPAHTRETGAGA